MKLIYTKTEFMVLASKHQLPQVNHMTVQVGAETISLATSARNIGPMMEAAMEMTEQVNQISRSCYMYCQLGSIST